MTTATNDAGVAELSLERGARVLARARPGHPPPARIALDETQVVAFHFHGAEPDTDYRIRIGSQPLEWQRDDASATLDAARGHRSGADVFWAEAPHFDGAAGLTRITLEARTAGEEWAAVVTLDVEVRPSKLGAARYRTMVRELASLHPQLVRDVTGKSLGRAAHANRSVTARLDALEAAWPEARAAIHTFLHDAQPARHTRRARPVPAARVQAAVAGGAVRRSLAEGRFPRVAQASGMTRSGAAKLDGPAHDIALLAALLARLEDRLRRMAAALAAEIRRVERDRAFRDVSIGGRSSIFESHDRPHIQRMHALRARALRLAHAVAADRLDPALRAVAAPETGLAAILETPSLAPLRRVLRPLVDAVHGPTRIAGYVRPTQRMYEQWVLFQILGALRIRLPEGGNVRLLPFARAPRQATLDLAHGQTWVFPWTETHALRVRYEPWIHPLDIATELGEPLCRDVDETSSWSPDIVIERVRRAGAEEPGARIEAALVVDAKYAVALTELHWSGAAKYLGIRERLTGRRVVSQVWLAYPGPDGQVRELEDAPAYEDAIDWPRSRTRGMLELLPPSFHHWSMKPFEPPVDAALRFAGVLLDQLKP